MNKVIDMSRFAGEKVLCAVSGGADSMCLLHALWKCGAAVTAAHYEHGIRGGESLRDCRFVENWCAERSIPCVTEHGDVPGYAREKGMGTEEAARRLRYAFLRKTAAELGCGLIATAHNADDNAETVLFNLTRGSGISGLRGIPYRRGNIIRPLLSFSRHEIEAYLSENAVEHVEDSTNAVDDYSRNLIRHRVMPVLRKINPGLSAAAARTSELLARDEDCLDGMAAEFVAEHYRGGSLPLRELGALHPAVSTRVIRRLLGGGLSMEHTDAVLKLCGESGYKQLELPGHRLACEQGRLYIEVSETELLPERAIVPGTELELPEAGLTLRAEIAVYGEEINGLFKTYYLKYENIGSALICGGRRPGDRVRPQGRGCTKTLRSLFMEAGYTQRQRNACPVIRDAAGVLAVYGLAVDERVRPEKGDKVLKLSFVNMTEK